MKTYTFLLSLSIFLSVASMPAYTQPLKSSSSDEVIALAKEFVELLAKENFSGATKHFDSRMEAAISPEKLKQIWKSLLSQIGPLKRQGGVRTEKRQRHDIVFVTCEFEESARDVKIVFNSTKRIAGLWFVLSQPPAEYKPPAYVRPASFQKKEVQIGTEAWALPGTLALPAGDGPSPALVLVHGSGPHDRDETIGPNKPFRDLAWGLASRGIAVLCYEKRTKAHAEKFASVKGNFTVKEETIEDALAAVSMLRKADGIDAKKIFLLGHSLGGTLIPRIGALDPDIAGFIVMAGTTRPLEDVYFEQMSYLFSLDGTISEPEETQLEAIKGQIAKVKHPELSVATPSTELPFGVPPGYWLDLRGYNPPEAAKNLKRPLFVLHGQRDYQVALEDFQGWENSLSSLPNVEFKLYPGLNHLFIAGEGKSTPAEYQTAGHVAETVIDDIANWIKKQ